MKMPYKNAGYIVISSQTKARLEKYKEGGDSWDKLLNELIDYFESKEGSFA